MTAWSRAFIGLAIVLTAACDSATPTAPTSTSGGDTFTTLTLTGATTIDQIGQTASIVAVARRADGTSQKPRRFL